MSNNNDNRIIRPDGMSAQAETHTVKIYDTEFPLPSKNVADIRKLCMRQVKVANPLSPVGYNVVESLAINADTALLLLEMDYALKERDKKIGELEEKLAELTRRFDDPAERDRQEGYDGVG